MRPTRQAVRPHLRPTKGSWRVDETYIRVKGRWTYLYRAVDSRGQTIDFLLTAKRDAAAARRFFRKALGQPHTVNPRRLPSTRTPPIQRDQAMKRGGAVALFPAAPGQYLNNIVEQDHRRINAWSGRVWALGVSKPPDEPLPATRAWP